MMATPIRSSSRATSAKWLVLILIGLVGYGLLQPVLNSKWGWNLPSLANLVSEQGERNSNRPQESSEADEQSVTDPVGERLKDSDLLYGLLKETRPGEFVSPAGLRYTRGSQEGHRLDHLARHLEDQPDRPGRHGVFQGDMQQVLRWLDEAQGRANRGMSGTSKRQEDGRTIVEVTFASAIGFVGGRDGQRQGHPTTKRLRMVLDSDRVITAFPF